MTPPTIPDHPHPSTALFYDPLTRKDPPPTAQTVQIHLEDDLDGGPADTTLTFALDGRDYEIGLSEANAEKLREALRPFVAAARTTTPSRGPRSPRAVASSSDPDTAKIRAWAKDHGHPVSDRGRIHQHIRDAYYAAHRPPPRRHRRIGGSPRRPGRPLAHRRRRRPLGCPGVVSYTTVPHPRRWGTVV